MTYLVDTSVVIRALHREDPDSETTRRAIRRLLLEDHTLVILPQIVAESWVVATRPASVNGLGRSPMEALRWTRRYRSDFELRFETAAVFERGQALVGAEGVSGRQAHDARLAAAMLVYEIPAALTLNPRDFERYPGLSIIHPRRVLEA